MLQNLHVKNLALITETEVEFKEGLNILTGETGAGKSIIIGSVALALGEKVPKELLRDNEETALVELVFSVENPKVLDAIRQLGIETEDETVILSRKITSGRAIARINGEAVSASRLKRWRLCSSIFTDSMSTSPFFPKRNIWKSSMPMQKTRWEKKRASCRLLSGIPETEKEWESSSLDTEERARELSFLAYEVKEIEEAQLSVGEDTRLEEQYRRFANAKRSWMPYRLPVQLPGETAVPERMHRNLSAVPCGKSVRFRHMRSALRRWNRCLPILIIC